MTCISWNCRGLGNPDAIRELRSIVKLEGPALLFVMETKLRAKRVEDLQSNLGFAACFAVDGAGLSGGIGLFWSRDVSVELKNYSQRHINILVSNKLLNSPPWGFTGFYGAPRDEDRHQNWRFFAFAPFYSTWCMVVHGGFQLDSILK